MAGVEAIAAFQLIDACIGITQTIIKICLAVKDAQGLPPTLRDLCEKLPAIEDLLESARESCNEGRVTEDNSKNAKPILEQCAKALGELAEIFRKACPVEGDDRKKRIWKGAKAAFFGRDSRVQKLLVIVQDNLKLLEQTEIFRVGDKLDELQQLTEALSQDDNVRITHTGSGNVFAMRGGTHTTYAMSGSARQINQALVYSEGPSSDIGVMGSRYAQDPFAVVQSFDVPREPMGYHSYLPPPNPLVQNGLVSGRDLSASDTGNTAQKLTAANVDAMVKRQLSNNNDVLTCFLDWELRACVKFDLDPEIPLKSCLTITGDALSAYAMTCEDWIRQNWGDLGISVLDAICEALLYDTFSSEHLFIRLDGVVGGTESAVVSIHYSALEDISKVVKTLAWLAVTFRPPGNGLSCSSAKASLGRDGLQISLEKLVDATPDVSTSCWHTLIGNTVIADGFTTKTSIRGLELSLPSMLDLTAMMYATDLSKFFEVEHKAEEQITSQPAFVQGRDQVEISLRSRDTSRRGIYFTGVHSVLYPVGLDDNRSTLKWHYQASDSVIAPPDNRWLRLCQSDIDGATTHILGYTPEVMVHLATEGRVQDYDRMAASSAYREQDSWGFSLDGISPQLGFSGSGISFPVKLCRRKGQRAPSTANPLYNQIIDQTVDKPLILFETASGCETAWLVSQLSVILDIVLWRAHRNRSWQSLDASIRAKLCAERHWDGGLAAQKVLADPAVANTRLETSADDGSHFAIKHLVTQIYQAMSVRAQIDIESPPPFSRFTAQPLVGWDMTQLTDVVGSAMRLQVKIHKRGKNNSTPTWLPLAREIPVFFCDHLGDIMTSAVPVCFDLQRDQKYMVASIQVLLKKMKKSPSCDEYHIDTKKQMVWTLPQGRQCFNTCEHTTHHEHASSDRFAEVVQLMLPITDHKCTKNKTPAVVVPAKGAVVFGPKELRTRRSDFSRQKQAMWSANVQP